MKMQLKSYQAFVAWEYRKTEVWLLPVVLLLACWVFAPHFGVTALNVCYWVYLYTDMTLDFWIMGGICKKHSAKMSFVKSSCYGYTELKMAIVTDQIRRFAMLAILSVGLMAITELRGFQYGKAGSVELWYTALLILMPYLCNTLLLNISRYIDFFQLYILVPSIGSSFAAGFLDAFGEQLTDGTGVTQKELILLVVLLILGIVATVATIWHVLFRIKQSYRDVE